jgi:hypothetical protein
MVRDGPAREHPSKISSTLFYFATIIIHGEFYVLRGFLYESRLT